MPGKIFAPLFFINNNLRVMKKMLTISILLIVLFSACQNADKKVTIDFADTLYTNKDLHSSIEKPIYIAISSMTSPEETLSNYNELLNYISTKINKQVVLKQRKTYKEINELLKNGDVDFAFICSGPYIDGERSSEMKLLVVPQYHGKTYYQAYIISNKNSDINSFSDLKGMKFAFTDPLSTTGKLFPHKLLLNLQTNERLFFEQTIYTYAHDISIQMVNRGIIEGASVHSIIYDHFVEFHPEKVQNVKIIEKSNWFGTPPVVVPFDIEKSKFINLQNIFLDIHNDSIGKKILEDLEIEKFVAANDTLYNSVRTLKNYSSNENN